MGWGEWDCVFWLRVCLIAAWKMDAMVVYSHVFSLSKSTAMALATSCCDQNLLRTLHMLTIGNYC